MELTPIQSKICEVRGVKVMLDFDIAGMYGIETKVLNQSVRRNLKRFPSDFMFRLTKQELTNLRSQFVTSSWGGLRYLPYAFTEHGVNMLASVVKSDVAIERSIQIVRAFVAMRQLILSSPTSESKELQKEVKALRQYVEEVFEDYNDINEDTRMQLELINETLAELQSRGRELISKPRRKIGFQFPHETNSEK